MDDAFLINHKHRTMFYLKDGPWEKLDLKRVGNIAFITESLYKLCGKLSDITKSEVPVYTIWLADQLVRFAKNADSSELELVEGNSKRYKQLVNDMYLFLYDRDMNSDARDDITAKLKKNMKKRNDE